MNMSNRGPWRVADPPPPRMLLLIGIYPDEETHYPTLFLCLDGVAVSVSKEYLAFVLDRLSRLGALDTRRLFGCVGIHRNVQMFALLDRDNQLFLKVDPACKGVFETAHCRPFTDTARGRTIALNYYAPPSDALEDTDEPLRWVRRGTAAAP